MKHGDPVVFSAARAVLIASLAATAFAQTQPRISAVRFWSLGEVTRVAIETEDEASYRADRLDSPDRLVVDLSGIERPAGTRGVQTIAVGDRLVKQIRIASLQPGVTRVVLDLTSRLEYSISQLKNPDRIIVELRVSGTGPVQPPVRSVTGNHPLGEPRDGPKPEAVKPAAVAAPKPAPTRIERLPEAPPVAKADLPQPPRTVPAAAPPKESKPLPEPPKIAPKVEKVETKVPFESARAAQSDSNGDRSLIRALGLKLERVVLDPGHGGHDTGTIGPDGYMEKELVLDVAKRLGALITKRLGSEVIYTRSDDTFIPLEERTRLANDKKADLFLSIHANSSHSLKISGSETFYLNFSTQADALEVAARENSTSQTSIHELQTLVQKITLNEKVQESRELAAVIQKSLYTGIPRNKGTRDRGVKKAPFVVLIGAQMPSVLAEVAFLSNPKDENMLKRADYRQKIALALFKGVSQYANTLSHFDVARQQPAGSSAR